MGLVLVVFGIVTAVVLGLGGLFLAVFGFLWARRAYSGPNEAANRSRS
jgi:hypothetical protein